MYKTFHDIHSKPCNYKFSTEAKKVYEDFSDEIVAEMNRQLEEDVIVEDNMSKDRKIFVRYIICYFTFLMIEQSALMSFIT